MKLASIKNSELSIRTDTPMQTVDSDQMPQRKGMKLVRGNREHGNLENTFRTKTCNQ